MITTKRISKDNYDVLENGNKIGEISLYEKRFNGISFLMNANLGFKSSYGFRHAVIIKTADINDTDESAAKKAIKVLIELLEFKIDEMAGRTNEN